jgi:fructose-bisphosphate aldolase, class I
VITLYSVGKLTRLRRMEINGKFMFLALDQGFEHGPSDFNERSLNPEFILDIAEKTRTSGVVLHKGIAEKYLGTVAGKVPLLLKLNGKTNLQKSEPLSLQVCSVKEAIHLGADAIGYTIYVGSRVEQQMYAEAGRIAEEAQDYGIPYVLWSYPRGSDIKETYANSDATIIGHAARVAAELGADLVKVFYTGNTESFRHVVNCGGRARVLAAGGTKKEGEEFLHEVKSVMDAGASGMAIGRNIWQYEDPYKMSRAVSSIIFDNRSVEEAKHILH